MFPKLVRNPKTKVRVVITETKPNEFNEKAILLDDEFLCNYQDVTSVRYTAEKQSPGVTGTIYIDGDILPTAAEISCGYVDIFGERREIAKGCKARNFDGTVNYTRLDVI